MSIQIFSTNFRMRKLWRLVVVFLTSITLMVVASSFMLTSATAASYLYVATTGSDGGGTNDCTVINNPCATIQRAIDIASNGDVILIAAGTYREALGTRFGISKTLNLSGGWDSTFSTQGANSIIDATDRTGPSLLNLALRLWNSADVFSVERMTFTGGLGYGGITNYGTLTLNYVFVTGNRAGGGGGIDNNGTLTVVDSTISANTAADQAGGIYNSGTASIVRSQVIGNSVDEGRFDGGGILNGGVLTIRDSLISGNTARVGGGVLSGSHASLTMNNTAVSGNYAREHGGGITNLGGSITLTESAVTYNTAVGDGGGIQVYQGRITLTNVSVSGNRANQGGGLALYGTSGFFNDMLSSTTVSGNMAASYGGGIHTVGGIKLQNTLIAGNSAGAGGPDCYGGSHESLGYSLFGISTGCSIIEGTGDLRNIDARLGPVVNGVQTLLPDSPAIDAADPITPGSGGTACPTIDQRGVVRPQDGNGDNVARCDIGSYEHEPMLNRPPFANGGGPYTCTEGVACVFDGTGSGDPDPGDSVVRYEWDFDYDGITFDTDASGVALTNPTHTYSDAPVLPTVALRVIDNHGATSAIATASVAVIYNFVGFFRPVDNLPTQNVVNAGRAIPVKLSLGGDQGLDIFATGYPTSTQVTCGTTAENAVEQTVTAGSSSLSYDIATDQYTYAWKTDKAWAGSCRTLVVKLNDGIVHQANFKFKFD